MIAVLSWEVVSNAGLRCGVWAQGISLDDLLGEEQPARVPKPPPGKTQKGPRTLLDAAASSDPPPPPPTAALVKDAKAELERLQAVNDARRNAGLPDGRSRAVRTLIDLAGQPGVEPAQRCALLEIGIEVAEAGNDPALLREAVDAMQGAFARDQADEPMLRFLQRVVERGPVAEFNDVASPAIREACCLARSMMERQRRMLLGEQDFTRARAAVENARDLVGIAPPAVAGQERGEVEAVAGELGEIEELVKRAQLAEKELKAGKAATKQRTVLGLFEVWREESGHWTRAIEHFRNCDDRDLRGHAESEAGFTDNTAGEEWRALGDDWWDVSERKDAQVIALDSDSVIAIPKTLRPRFRMHAGACYEKALAAGLVNPLHRDLAMQRIEELQKAATKLIRRPEQSGYPPPQPQLPVAAFQQAMFDAIERDRSLAMRRLQDAAASANFAVNKRAAEDLKRAAEDLKQAAEDLTSIREKWVAALDLGNRANNMQGQRAAIRQVLQADPGFADGHLAHCFIQIMLGDQAAALTSLNKADALMQARPWEQVISPLQWLDLGRAAVLLGDRNLADKVRNVFRKNYPNDPGVRLLSALIFVDKKLFAEAKREFEHARKGAPQSPLVAAEYAWFLVSRPQAVGDREFDQADQLADQFLRKPTSNTWRLLRTKAAVAAHEGRWAEALVLLGRVQAVAPLIYQDELKKQRQTYEHRKEHISGK